MRILLLGYYGQGNFGDDVLLSVTYRLLREKFPQAHIVIVAESNNYISKWFPEAGVVCPGRYGYFDLIVHGGGGIFFDFAQGPLWRQRLEECIETLGWHYYVFAEKWLRKALNRQRSHSPKRIGLGLGVGGYARGSLRLWQQLPVLADFKKLWLRDAEGAVHLRRFQRAMSAEIIRGSDLAFLTHYWRPDLPARKPSDRPRLGVILRDWKNFPYAAARSALDILGSHYQITGFVFDTDKDPKTIAMLEGYPVEIWQPEKDTLADFSARLAGQDVLLTARAHGGICGACLGVPSVLIEVEPKLRQVHGMLPNATVMASALDPSLWPEALARAMQIVPAAIAQDVEANRLSSQKALIQCWKAA